MGLQDKIANQAQVLKGKGKEAAGKITDNPRLVSRGQAGPGQGQSQAGW